MLAAEFGVGQAVWTMFWFFIFFLWIMLVFQVVVDIFRSEDMGGGMKALWVIFVIVTPYLGVFVYLIARGGKMGERQMAMAKQQEVAAKEYIRDAAGAVGPATELARLNDLRKEGVIDEAEFNAMKAKILG